MTFRVSESSLIGLLILSCFIYCNKEGILGVGNMPEFSMRQKIQRGGNKIKSYPAI